MRFLTEGEVAETLRCSTSKVKRLRLSGRLAYVPGRPVLIDVEELQRFVERETRAERPGRDHAPEPARSSSVGGGTASRKKILAAPAVQGRLAVLAQAGPGQPKTSSSSSSSSSPVSSDEPRRRSLKRATDRDSCSAVISLGSMSSSSGSCFSKSPLAR